MGIVYPLTLPRVRQGVKTSWKLSQSVAYGESDFSKQGQSYEHSGGRWVATVTLDDQKWSDGLADWIGTLAALKGSKGTFWLGFPAATAPRGTALPDTAENMLTYSEDFTHSDWSTQTQRTAVAANAIIAPDGTTTAESLIPHATSGTHYTYQPKDFIAGISYSYSIYAKTLDGGGGGYHLALRLDNGAFPSDTYGVFDLDNGTAVATTSNGATASIEDVGGGWYRCTLTQTANTTASSVACLLYVIQTAAETNGVPDTLSYAGTTSHGIHVWGAQLRQSSNSSQYRQSTSAAVAASSPRIDGASQTGSELITTGWLPGQNALLKKGDFFQVGNYLYMSTQQAVSDVNGGALIDVAPALRESPSDGEQIITSNPQGLFRLISADVPLGDYSASLANAGRVSFQAISV